MVVDGIKSDQDRAACQVRIRDSGDQSGENFPGLLQWQEMVCGWVGGRAATDRMFGGFEINETVTDNRENAVRSGR